MQPRSSPCWLLSRLHEIVVIIASQNSPAFFVPCYVVPYPLIPTLHLTIDLPVVAIGSYPSQAYAHLQLLLCFAHACALVWRRLSGALNKAEVLAAVDGVLLCCTLGSLLLTSEHFPGSVQQLLLALSWNQCDWCWLRFPFPGNFSFGTGLLIESWK